MEIVWEDPPIPDSPFFTREAYDKYSLAPTIRELWESLQSPEKSPNTESKGDGLCKKKKKKKKKKKMKDVPNTDGTLNEESLVGSHDGDEGPSSDTAADVAVKVKEEAALSPFPEPRVPYPCFSILTSKDQRAYLQFLLSNKSKIPPQNLMARVNDEVMQFTRYLQDAAKVCAEDYNFITPGAMKYSEEFFSCCAEFVKTLPQFYRINEMTSLTGGTFNPALTLSFEKQLLIMGKVDITDHKMVPADAPLASDYPSVSSENPPAKKAKDMHAAISSDGNAEMLCARYEPHVCLTRDAMVTLLDNHSPEFAERWELPVVVKTNPRKGSLQQRTVYVDSPLPKTEVTVRERSRLFHEESLKLSIKRNGSQNVFSVMTELPHDEKLKEESGQRNVVSFESDALDFDVDLTDLETFGDTAFKTPKSPKKLKQLDVQVVTPTATCVVTAGKSSLIGRKASHDPTNIDQNTTGDKPGSPVSDAAEENPKLGLNSDPESTDEQMITGDSEDERLVIDDCLSPSVAPAKVTAEPSVSPSVKSSSSSSSSSTPHKVTKQIRQQKRARVSGDQLSEILQMQTNMFSSNATESSATTQDAPSTPKRVESTFHPVSLVKPCVTSYLERSKSDNSPEVSTVPLTQGDHKEPKKILSQELQAGAEDEQDYKAPEEGNLLYKLYSLEDLLLMVRSSVSLTHTRRVASSSTNQHVPVQVLPKLEYQLSYGVERLSRGEACQLWAEAALHSSTVSYIAHIDAHTSRVALLRKLPDDWTQSITCGFKASKSLNILHHLLKKLTRLEEGSYLLAHKPGEPFVSILKAAEGKGRGEYNLLQVHSGPPQPSSPSCVPWIPVDPVVVLPFHQTHQRVPCTFPPPPKVVKDGAGPSVNLQGRQPQNKFSLGGNKNKKGRAARRKNYIKRLVQKSV
ncbi:little elongation complex subunit 2 isoform X1 [Synchiropus splendidus]|uniref:little elongation complex subunit 2 isoform X1 n=2 Tax=Synchiropus splendidus TaxID=270530 RepID=UPI00237D6816|nr:little elongation complex subunit 2 isoform X1 [Synchiropus splendidus]XP_053741719.1 little elongation complex subunit 2 isoform X1 [Synchiropus splendidus]